MATFAQAMKNRVARTLNNMKALETSGDRVLDLFQAFGASRGKDIIPAFVAAYTTDRELALRVVLWGRDIRGGSGERKLFRDVLNWLELNYPEDAKILLNKVSLLGRWDDVLAANTKEMREYAFSLIKREFDLNSNNIGLVAKWMPRKGKDAAELRAYLDLSPKRYRKLLVEKTKVVESQMCAKDWDNINFSHVPSVASARYRKAFFRNTPKYAEYVANLKKGDPKLAKVNATALYPYDVVKNQAFNSYVEKDFVDAQWNALPNYMNGQKVLPVVDVSGSMSTHRFGNISAMEIAISLGMYCSEKNTGPFKDIFVTFSGTPKFEHLSGSVTDRYAQIARSHWDMNTNLHAVFEQMLKMAKSNNVPESEMPDTILILSDMQFDECTRYDDSAMEMIARKYAEAGYTLPKVVFWTLNSYANVPVRENDQGVALVSGFSPSILEAVLANDLESYTPRNVMLKKIMHDRYSLVA